MDNWRWAGVPFYLRTGKRLPKRVSEVAIQFKDVPQVLFNTIRDAPLEPTVFSLRVQPEEGLSMRIASKLPGPKMRIYPVKMEFNYSSSFGNAIPEAYERLLLDVMAGDATLFMRRDPVDAAWRFVMPILNRWEQGRVRDLPEYQCGTWGPIEADRIVEADGRSWRNLMTTAEQSVAVPLRQVEAERSRQMKVLQGTDETPIQRLHVEPGGFLR